MKIKLIVLITLMISATSCIALREDVDVAKSQLQADMTVKDKLLEEKITKIVAEEIDKISRKLAEFESSQQKDKQAQTNKIDLSFSTMDELRETIKELNNRIDNVDMTAQKNTAFAERLDTIDRQLAVYEEQLRQMKQEISTQIDEIRPVENLTISPDGKVIKLPENVEKSYKQLVDFTQSATSGDIARRGWALFAQKWPNDHKCDVAYWNAESYFLEKNYNTAVELFYPIEKSFPGCVKIESSYLKIAFSLAYTDRAELAQSVVTSMKSQFPKSAFPDKLKELEKLIEGKLPKKKAPAAQPSKKPAKQPAKQNPSKKTK
ncbi:hypothetical protein IKR20_02765 [bacterium]|nr:hypothetical protein [bacterium]